MRVRHFGTLFGRVKNPTFCSRSRLSGSNSTKQCWSYITLNSHEKYMIAKYIWNDINSLEEDLLRWHWQTFFPRAVWWLLSIFLVKPAINVMIHSSRHEEHRNEECTAPGIGFSESLQRVPLYYIRSPLLYKWCSIAPKIGNRVCTSPK